MSISRLSLNFCFWRLLMMENAIAMVSSCMSRLVSTSGMSSPLMRSTGCDPTLRWRSEAFRSDAIFKRSLICMTPLSPSVPAGLTRARLAAGDGARRPRLADEGPPAVLVGHAALDDFEERPLERLGHGAAGALAHRDLVHRADGRDLRRGAREEQLVGQVQQLARDPFLGHGDAEPPGQGQHGVAGDARE